MISAAFYCFNEKTALFESVPRLESYLDYLGLDYEVVVAQLGSKVPDAPHVRVVDVPPPGTIGQTQKAAIRACLGEKILLFGADLPFKDLSFVADGLKLLDRFDFVMGSKRMGTDDRPFSRRTMSRLYDWWNHWRYSLPVYDIGGNKFLRRSTVVPLLVECHSDGLRFDIEILQALKRHGLAAIEIPTHVVDHRNPLAKRLRR